MRGTSTRFVVLWFITLQLSMVTCTAVFELKLSLFKNEDGLNTDGNCCNGFRKDGKCSDTCRTFFWICLTHYQKTIPDDASCTFASVTTPILGSNSVNFSAQLPVKFDNPLDFSIPYSWPGTFSLIVNAYHDTTLNGPAQGSPRELVSTLKTQRSLDAGGNWLSFTHSTRYTELNYSYRVYCDDNYYGSECSNFCRPRNDPFGHYRCDETGQKVCVEGWEGPYCDRAICLPGCHPDHGFCDAPYECNCRMGYKGTFCEQCEKYPGCMNGTCTKPWECICEEGWGGLFCNQDLNFCTHHSPCRNGGICTNTGQGSYTCTCQSGFMGTNCEIEMDDCEQQPCQNGGTCQDSGTGYKCKCPDGFTGRRCDTLAVSCENEPCKNGAPCENTNTSYRCTCLPGYTGYNCDAEINECAAYPCLNKGRCVDELNGYRCVCAVGFQGQHCEENIVDCKQNTCLNGGTCRDRINGFECHCIPGFVGSLCQKDVDDCELRPCSNGGTCHDKVNDFTCDCLPGFTGKDCRVIKNECENDPCKNGGSCMDLLNDFQCLCLSGFSGKDCRITDDTTPNQNGSIINVVNEIKQSAEEEITMMQLVLIVCLGVGIPLLLLIIVVIFFLLRKRNPSPAEPHATEKEQNLQNSHINNKLESGIFTTGPLPQSGPGVSNVKTTNEDNDFNTFKPGHSSYYEKPTNKQFLYSKDLNTEKFAKTPPPPPPPKDINIKHSECYDTDNSSGSNSINDVSCYNTDIHIIGSSRTLSKDTNRHSASILEQHAQHVPPPHHPHVHRQSFYGDEVLATEV
ncbi:delta-like protein D [Mizuhopecten yessoensis]|uniref:Delta-like protein n=1 Tax=Mizuhopecten yessoensis TaxID=6573 RepID=A0A210PXJ1_MIZYE|nr:delta-like protein D [Mizuhopecten yessoensis]XP_021372653.1 delta-like protein D [Mizuhopecten yessoensis]XP_021372654.1 delta-like protein D [Mizuhopecten yessoensis]XP_021372655.1 delta-like protein D [Mizuhopecten yessoensis]XP_021372656.1 delta-like protein D [Mizuhopecten yessoensis]XP_021372658.1 delta-like protein D [Mizuhopecten yessoensis]OWF41210.1 Neurogenic locus protein delta [Mizuhopecten yessoensis]